MPPELRAGRAAPGAIIHYTPQRGRDIPVRLARNVALLLGIYDREALMRRVREFLKRE